ncbi:glycosyltransferase [Ligilactobacillus salivarius]|uniref:Glycosyltransferase n=1 Tax=Ligilactobacillus salivarius TaxID=1624 RepID=A0AAW7N6I0_9LACO|nr:glycosyltransferase [Ligilactobacillus salivarius]MDN4832801.1 glycosyltransferase [Ligilactobacillus salivarius]
MSSKIKIAVFLVGLSGGAGQVVLNYFQNMSDNYDIDIITTHVESEELLRNYTKDKKFHVYKIPTKKESLIKNISMMNKILKSKNYSVAYAHMTLTNCFPLFVAWLRGIKIRISHSHLAPRKKKNIFEKMLAFLTKLFATEYIACGNDAGKYLYGSSDFIILKNAINLEKYKYSENVKMKQKKLLKLDDETKKIIGHVGRFDTQKNHDFIINLFKKYKEKYPNTHLCLMGEGVLEEEIKEKVRNLGLDNDVTFMGRVDDVYNKLQMLDAFILPSLFEGLSISAIEAQAVGINCVFSSTVSKETKVTENVDFISLDEDYKIWINKLHSAVEKDNLKDEGVNALRKNGYDIHIESKKFEKYLLNLIGE